MASRIILNLLSLTAFVVLSSSSARAADQLVFGLVPEMNVFRQMERFEPLGQYLEKKVGKKVGFTILSRYGNMVERLKEKAVDGAFLGSFTGALAISQLGVEPLARPVTRDGESTYKGYIFVRKDSGITTVEQMRGKVMAFVEKATTAGYIFPEAYFKHQGVKDLSTFFKEFFFAGSHDATIIAVLERNADIGAAKNTIYDRVKASNSRVAEELTILAESPRVPSNALCVRQEMDDSLKKRLKETLLKIKDDPEGAPVLEKLGFLRFVETTMADYQPVFDMATEAGIDLKHYQYYNQ